MFFLSPHAANTDHHSHNTCVLVPGGKTTWLPIKFMYMLGSTVKVTVISRLLSAERFRGMNTVFSWFISEKDNLGFTKPRRAELDKDT